MTETTLMSDFEALSIDSCDLATAAGERVRPAAALRELMMAVLDDAIHSLSSARSLVRREAEHWMASANRDYVFSFLVICETLDLDPRAVRRSILGRLSTTPGGGRVLRRTRGNVRRGGTIAKRAVAG